MNFEKLLEAKKIERVKKSDIDFRKIEDDLKAAKDAFNSGNFEWAMSIAYHSVLRSSMNLMNFIGYRAVGREHHKNTFEFLEECNIEGLDIRYFNKVRIKRNNFVYRSIDEVGEGEVREIIQKAEEFVQKIRTFVQKIRT